jgi:hypothetical protein
MSGARTRVRCGANLGKEREWHPGHAGRGASDRLWAGANAGPAGHASGAMPTYLYWAEGSSSFFVSSFLIW